MTTITPHAVEVCGLTATRAGSLVLDGIDFTIPPGTVFALLGPNGAGKTTTVRVLSTLLAPDSGSVRICGHDLADHPSAVRASIGVTGQFSAVDTVLTVRENLSFMAALHRIPRSERESRTSALVTRFGLTESVDRPASTLSGGTVRRLDLAMTLLGNPRVVFLDEPTTGIDPRSRRDMWSAVDELVANGTSVLLTTQYLDEAAHLADDIAILDRGRIVARGTPQALTERIQRSATRLHLRRRRSVRFTVHTPTLDDVFLFLTSPTTSGSAS